MLPIVPSTLFICTALVHTLVVTWTNNSTTQTEPTDWNIKIRDAKRKRAEARTLLKAADEDLNNDADDDNANIIKNDAERVLKRTPVLLRYFEAMAKSEKADADKTISSDKKEEFRRSADTCKKALDDYDKTEGQGGKEIKKD